MIAFRESDPYRLVADPDPQTAELVYKVRVNAELPIELAIIAGEAIHQLRSSLDHLAWQLVEANGNSPGKWTYFPISETAAKYKTEAPGKVKGVNARAISVIDALQPYQAGNDALWMLHDLNIFEKHRLLFIVAARADNAGIEIQKGDVLSIPAGATFQIGVPASPLTPGAIEFLKDGTEIARLTGHSGPEVQADLRVACDIVFSKPRIVCGKPVIPFLHQLSGLVNEIVNLFVPFL